MAVPNLMKHPAAAAPETVGRWPSPPRWKGWPTWLALAAIAYVPLFFNSAGQVVADTKVNLYLDPGRFTQSVASMWDPNIGMGTVTHQFIGYLLPMGPFYWVMLHAGLPVWIVQRLWLGSLLFLAGTGAMYLLRVLGLEGPGRVLTGVAYMLSPYLLAYAARESVLLMPWAALPWMLGLAVMALRRGGWRYPALFALVVALVSGVNATAVLYAGIGPALWFPYAVWVSREATLRQAVAALARISLLVIVVSVWWVAGLWVEGAFNLPVLRYTETVQTVSKTSLASEVLRGLGYWYFYGQDQLGSWIQPAVDYTQRLWLIAVSFSLPILAFFSAFVVRWRYRAFFVALLAVGAVLAVGVYPYGHPTPVGAVLKAAGNGSTIGLALRSTGRAVPLVVLGTAVLLGVASSALWRRYRVAGLVTWAVVVVLALVNMYPLWAGRLIGGNLLRPEALPSYWTAATSYLDTQGRSPSGGGYQTRVLGLPGQDFASYRWGTVTDQLPPALLQRPYVARELFADGTAGTVDLVNAFDSRLQQGTFEPGSLAPIARLMSVGDVLLQSDQQYERYNTPRPKPTWALLDPPPPGIEQPIPFGKPFDNIGSQFPMLDEITLGEPAGEPDPPPLAVLPVPGARPIVRSEPAGRPLLVDGDGLGLVYAAPTGLLDTNAAVLYSPSLTRQPATLQRALAAGSDLLVTDTNRKQGRRWSTVRENTGYTEQAGETPAVYDPTNQALPLFPGETDSSQTVAQQLGVASVVASAYGNNITYTPEDRAANALDGDLHTSWIVGDFGNPVGQWIRVTLVKPVTTNHLTLVQPLYGSINRWMTRVTLTFDGKNPITVDLGPPSRTPGGQTIGFPTRSFSSVQMTVDETNTGPRADYSGLSGVGLAELSIPGVHMTQMIRLPEDLLRAAGASSLGHNLFILLTRDRTAPTPPRSDPETHMARELALPTARSFSLSGTARLSAAAPDNVVDSLLGQDTHGIIAYSSSRLPGDVRARASAAIDGDPSTFWSPGFGTQAGNWIEYDLASPVTFSRLDMQVLADGRHSVPTRITVSTEQGARTVELPRVLTGTAPNATAATPASFPPITGRKIRITIDAVDPVTTTDYYSARPITTPVGIAEAGIPGVAVSPPPTQLPGTCRQDLVSIDGAPVSVAVEGSATAAEDLDGLRLVPCSRSSGPLQLGPGEHTMVTANGSSPSVGVNVDQILMASARGGKALPVASQDPGAPPGEQVAPVNSGGAPKVTVVSQNNTVVSVRVANPGHPFWLVLGQSQSRGWTATLGDGRSLGTSTLIDGYANGWWVQGRDLPKTITVTLRFAPQNWVWAALALSALGLGVCLLIVAATWIAPWRRRHERQPAATPAVDDGVPRADWAGAAGTPTLPEIGSPFTSAGEDVRGWATVVWPLVGAGLAGLLVSPWAAPAVGIAVLAGLRYRSFRSVMVVAAVGLLALAALYSIVQQHRYHFPPIFEWPSFLPLANSLAWMALAAVVADALVQFGRSRQRRR